MLLCPREDGAEWPCTVSGLDELERLVGRLACGKSDSDSGIVVASAGDAFAVVVPLSSGDLVVDWLTPGEDVVCGLKVDAGDEEAVAVEFELKPVGATPVLKPG